MDLKDTKKMSESLKESHDVESSEQDILNTLLGMTEYKDEEPTTIDIRRKGKLCLSFRIRVLSDDEIQNCRRKASIYAKNKSNRQAPKQVIEVDDVKYKSLLIYTATVDEDKKRIWGNAEYKDKFGLMENYETIDKVLLPGEKVEIVDKIFAEAGYGEENVTIRDFDEGIKN